MERKLPIGIQGFEKLRSENYVYVDKTRYIYNLVHSSSSNFLSRPRRFGKSLLLSTLRSYWEGKKNLFKGLEIEQLESANADAWKDHPVFYFDFNGENYKKSSLESVLDSQLKDWEDLYGNQYQDRSLGDRFQKLLEMAFAKTGLRSVVLVDEYDKPLLDVLDDKAKEEHNKEVFKSFFSVLKKADESIQFVLITGVTKFNKVSIFSDLNQLNDISLNKDFSAVCGITEEEIKTFFGKEISELSSSKNISIENCYTLLKKRYDGYYFHPFGIPVYNPFSLLKAFYEKDFGSYWFETGTPTFLVKMVKDLAFDIRKMTDRTLYVSESKLSNYKADSVDLIPLLYQTGYLSISDFDERLSRFTLSFPNEEVEYGFLECLLPEYVPDVQ